MAGEFLSIRKEVASRKKKMCVKLIYSITTSTIISFFSNFLVKFLRNGIKYVVSRAVSVALSGALKLGNSVNRYSISPTVLKNSLNKNDKIKYVA